MKTGNHDLKNNINQRFLINKGLMSAEDVDKLSIFTDKEISNLEIQSKNQGNFFDLYKNFNGELLAGKIKLAYSLDKSFHLQAPNELRYFTRKHPVIHEYLTLVCDDIIR